MLLVAIDGGAMMLHVVEQVRCIRRRDTLRGEMAADIEVGRILFLLDALMLLARLLHFLILRATAFAQRVITRLKFATSLRDVFVRLRDQFLFRGQFGFSRPTCLRAPE